MFSRAMSWSSWPRISCWLSEAVLNFTVLRLQMPPLFDQIIKFEKTIALVWKLNSTPLLYLKLPCSLKIVNFRPVLVKISPARATSFSIFNSIHFKNPNPTPPFFGPFVQAESGPAEQNVYRFFLWFFFFFWNINFLRCR